MKVSKKPVKGFFERFEGRKNEGYDILEKELRDAIGESSSRLEGMNLGQRQAGEGSTPSQAIASPSRSQDPMQQLMAVSDSPAVETQSPPSEPSAISADEQPTREPSSMQMSDMDALLVGATPLLAGLLTGNMQDAYSASSSGLMTLAKWRMDKEKQKAKEAVKSGRMTLEEYMARLQAKEESEKRLGKGKIKMTTPEGEEVLVDKGSEVVSEPIPTTDVSGLTKRQSKLLDTRVKEFDSSMKANDEALKVLAQGYEGIGQGQLGDKIGVMSLVKSIETRLSDYDRAYYTQEISLLDRLYKTLEQQKTNELNPRLVKDAKRLMKVAIRKAKEYREVKRKSMSKKLEGRGVPYKKSYEALGSFDLPIREPKPDMIQNGYRYKWIDNTYKAVEKIK